MIRFTTILALFLVLFSVPVITFAAPSNFVDLVNLFISIINIAVTVLIALAVLGFFWGLTRYILSANDSTKIEEGRKVMVYGFIGLFVAVSLWGILLALKNTFL